MWSRCNGVLHRSAQNHWPLGGALSVLHSSATTSSAHQQSIRPGGGCGWGLSWRSRGRESHHHRFHSSFLQTLGANSGPPPMLAAQSIKVANGHLKRCDGGLHKTTGRHPSTSVSVTIFSLSAIFSRLSCPICYSFCFPLRYIQDREGAAELEVIPNGLHARIELFHFFRFPAYFLQQLICMEAVLPDGEHML